MAKTLSAQHNRKSVVCFVASGISPSSVFHLDPKHRFDESCRVTTVHSLNKYNIFLGIQQGLLFSKTHRWKTKCIYREISLMLYSRITSLQKNLKVNTLLHIVTRSAIWDISMVLCSISPPPFLKKCFKFARCLKMVSKMNYLKRHSINDIMGTRGKGTEVIGCIPWAHYIFQ